MIRVVVAARSPLQRARASALLAGVRDLELVDVVRGSADALARIEAAAPHVLLLGTDLLEGAPHDLLREVRLRHPMPVLLLAASDADPRALAGLEQGAAEFVILPGLAEGAEREAAARDVAALIREVAARGARALHGGPRPRRLPTAPPMRRAGRAPRLVVVGASTGGPRAVQSLLEALPGTLNAALVVALHMPARFTSLYAERLARVCRLAVREAADGERLAAGGAVVIPGGRQAELFRLGERLHLRLRARGAGEVHAPSVDRVMRSAAAAAGAAAVGIVLTGMGDDGAQGLLAIRAAGGATIAESDRTALIFGMPGEAIRAGAAGAVLPLDEIPAALLERCGVRAPEEPGDD